MSPSNVISTEPTQSSTNQTSANKLSAKPLSASNNHHHNGETHSSGDTLVVADMTTIRLQPRRPLRLSIGNRTLSFVIPIKDEQDSILDLYAMIEQEVAEARDFEIIFIDDGSNDASWQVITELARANPHHVRGLRFRRNVGKAAALSAGFRSARGSVVFTLDGDLQDDPREIRRFLEKLDEGFDLVSGWKKVRHDPWHKVWPSRVFNRMISRLGGVPLHDHNCGFKCYKAEVAKSLAVYGDLHRMIPSLAALQGYRSTEIEVLHHPRRHGISKYGVGRILRGFFDMFTIYFLRHFSERPAHFCGGVGVIMLACGLFFLGGSAVAGEGMLRMTAVGIGAALLAAAPAIWTLGCIAELLNRSGLQRTRELPICEDTQGYVPSK
ncbi:MAG: glycosyltransferase family 2 protein [Planctomycetia bacterium]|nr:glycosyltransferase family 2 protein [Planctomycetia bacterium]